MRHQQGDENIKVIFAIAASLILCLAAIVVLLPKIFSANLPGSISGPLAEPVALHFEQTIKKPRLQTNESADLKIYLDQQAQRLSTYGWVDRAHKIVRVPIERAIDKLVQEKEPQK
jgi:hypothetical protein